MTKSYSIITAFRSSPEFVEFGTDLDKEIRRRKRGDAAGKGKGISRGRGHVRDTFAHLTSRDIEKQAIYFPLGKCYVNKKRLMENVLYREEPREMLSVSFLLKR